MIVEDEKWSKDLMLKYVSSRVELNLLSVARDGKEALRLLQENPVELLFLDINLPFITGLEILKKLDNPPYIIFTTVSKKYAIDAFNIGAVDYLVKPINKERFNISINRAIQIIISEKKNSKTEVSKTMIISLLQNDYHLTLQEALICTKVKDGMTRPELLAHFNIKAGTLKYHLKTIYGKTIDKEQDEPTKTSGKMQILTSFLHQLRIE